jgi:hypothetical protein
MLSKIVYIPRVTIGATTDDDNLGCNIFTNRREKHFELSVEVIISADLNIFLPKNQTKTNEETKSKMAACLPGLFSRKNYKTRKMIKRKKTIESNIEFENNRAMVTAHDIAADCGRDNLVDETLGHQEIVETPEHVNGNRKIMRDVKL